MKHHTFTFPIQLRLIVETAISRNEIQKNFEIRFYFKHIIQNLNVNVRKVKESNSFKILKNYPSLRKKNNTIFFMNKQNDLCFNE